ncbi:helix-turn-helix domain-containing protein [Hydrogenophaga sp. PBL-H3]|uniref:helix-turn-helix domain-containing protein n=1 Tax=Hydrogenophaga sp. PBL-H3 TaxID=434010 RepID=UPI00131F59BA|nr:helix-turn-helix domain-containing protein [Hydrogenophaga sp. PBL-H3]QHE75082.1 Fis family transcriptional regulator [Hydrogenophaga sp. PBL-H3]QHE79509.1 Fis family transcriptional regulator [Hydrogenophaga sp. PBL-H3]
MQHPPKLPSTFGHAAPPRTAGLFFATPEQRVALAREMFFDEGQRPSGLVPELVIQSWMRCTVANRRPGEPVNLEPVTKARIASALARNRLLLQAASHDLQQLDAALAGTPCKALLTGPDGVLIQATPTVRGEGDLMPHVARVGVNLNETHMGTTAPSVVARTGEACVVRGAEHFFTGVSIMQCAAAPIRNARGDLAGVLDLSTEGEAFRFDAAAMVRLYATAIENRLFEAQSAALVLLRFQSSPALLNTPLEGLAAVDGNGGVAWLNQTGASLLGTERVPARPTDAESLFGLGLEDLLALSHRGQAQPRQLPNGLTLWIQARHDAPRAPAIELAPEPEIDTPADVPAIPTLHHANRALIESTLAACDGNVSRAARQLGVSRGLLYRRLGEWRGEH